MINSTKIKSFLKNAIVRETQLALLFVFISSCAAVKDHDAESTEYIFPEGVSPEYLDEVLASLPKAYYIPGPSDEQICTEEGYYPPADLLAKANQSDADAQWHLATLYLSESECVNSPSGLLWMKIAADNGSAAAANELGYAFLNGRFGFSKSRVLAKKWLDKSVAGNDPVAALNLALYYRLADDGLPDDTQISNWLRVAVDGGEAFSVFEYSFRCMEGITNSDDTNCKDYISRAEKLDNPLPSFINACLLSCGVSATPVEWFIHEDFWATKKMDFERYPDNLYSYAIALMEGQVELADELLAKIGYEPPADERTERRAYAENLLFVAGMLGSVDAQSYLSSTANRGIDSDLSLRWSNYWANRLANNRRVHE